MALGRPEKFQTDELLDEAVDLIWREGPFAMSLNEIAASLGTTKPALSRRFGGKDDFLISVLRRYHERIDTPVQQAIAEASTVQQVAEAYLGSYVTALSQKPVGPATGCLLAAATEACANQPGTHVAENVRALNEETRAGLIAALKRTGARQPENLAQYLYGQSVALAFLSRNGADSNELHEFAKRAVAVDLT